MFAGRGTVAGHELISSLNEIFYPREAATPIRYALIDMGGVQSYDVNVATIRAMAEIHLAAARRHPGMVVAIYVVGLLAYGLARMWELYTQSSGWEVEIFRYRADAVDWIKEQMARRAETPISVE